MIAVRCDMENCYWRIDGNCSREIIKIKDYHCENYRYHIAAKIVEHTGREDDHYWFCSRCNSRDVGEYDKFCSQCGVKF